MGDDDTAIQDVDYSSAAAELVASKEQLNHHDIDAAAQSLIDAAANARAREFDSWGIISAPDDFPDDRRYDAPRQYHDKATDQIWVQYDGNTFWVYDGLQAISGGVPTVYGNDDPTKPEKSQYEWIRPKFQYFGERWPSYPQTMAQHCVTAKQAIQSGEMAPIVSVNNAVLFWQGDAARHYKDYFLSPYLLNAIPNQQTLLDELAVAMHAYEAILVQGQIDAKTLAEQGVDHLDSLNVGSGIDWGVVLGVAGVVVSVVATVATAGTATPLVLGLIGASVSAASVAVSVPEKIEGAYTDEVMDGLDEVLTALRHVMEAEEQLLADQLMVSADSVGNYLASTSPLEVATVLPNEPAGGPPNLTDGKVPDPGDFHPR